MKICCYKHITSQNIITTKVSGDNKVDHAAKVSKLFSVILILGIQNDSTVLG